MDESTAAFIVLSGRVKLQDTRSNKAVAISDITKIRDTLEQEDREEDKMVLMGKIFGLSDLLKNSNRLQFAICREECNLLRITRNDWDDIRDQIDRDIRQNFESVYKFLPEIRFVATSVQEKVVTLFERVSYPRGHFIISEGQNADVVYYICDGECSLTKTVGDEFKRETLSIASLGPGASIGEEILLRPKERCSYTFSCQVESNRVVIYKISRDCLQKLPKAIVSKMTTKAKIKEEFYEERLASFEDSPETKFKKEVKKKEYQMKFPLISHPSVRKLEKCQEYNSLHLRENDVLDPVIENQKINFKRNYSLMTFVSGRKENLSPTHFGGSGISSGIGVPSVHPGHGSSMSQSASTQSLVPYMSSPKNLTLSETLQADSDKVKNYIEKSKEEDARHYPGFRILARHRDGQRKNISINSVTERGLSKIGPGRTFGGRAHNIHVQKTHNSSVDRSPGATIPLLKARVLPTGRQHQLLKFTKRLKKGSIATKAKKINPLRLFTPSDQQNHEREPSPGSSRSPSHAHTYRRVLIPVVNTERIGFGRGGVTGGFTGTHQRHMSETGNDADREDDSTVTTAFQIMGLEAKHPRTRSSLN
mmetsp:Transcript_65454/g.75274  ORF Transcript_65454/g.75274 Transcript_65454/m.75274 type:complete len:593 (+) Transcript_65454:277-2055(+)